jgi:cell wall-associated NlpC family hydrolase
VQKRPSGSTGLIGTLKRRGVAIPLGLLAAGVLVISGLTVAASAAPQPSIAQVQARLNHLNTQFETLVQKYDQVQLEIGSANQRLALANRQAVRYLSRFNGLRAQVAQIAAAAYERGSLSSPSLLLTSGNPQQFLNEVSILQELASSNSAELSQFLVAARLLTGAQQAARRTRDAESELRAKLVIEKNAVNKTINDEKALLARLTPAQQAVTGVGAPTSPPLGTIGGHDPLPASTLGEKAVKFAYAQLGCPYVFGGTGPCGSGYDCSGLTQAAWAAAGVSIPRTSYEQWNLPHVPLSALKPGDLILFNGEGHSAVYVGNGHIIDALNPQNPVQYRSLSGWYLQTIDGAVRP